MIYVRIDITSFVSSYKETLTSESVTKIHNKTFLFLTVVLRVVKFLLL